ncbi:MAG TPA: flagellar basal body protein, partial [Nevskiaceae bacterium]|nr:flagellar basal body protein [Nevskiaceae bacterium]
MADLLNIGISGLLAYRRALDTAGHNIANVGTDGYSRQRVEFVSRLGQGTGDGYIGAGVDSSTVRRITDSFIQSRITADTSAYGRAETLAGLSATLDGWLSDSTTGLAGPMASFFDDLNA